MLLQKIRDWLDRRGGEESEHREGRRIDAMSAAAADNAPSDVGVPGPDLPPGYFPKQDEGRPRH